VFVSVDSFSSFYLTEFGGSDEEENVTAGDGSTGNSTEEMEPTRILLMQ